MKVDEHGYSLTCTSAACHALQDRSQAKIAALSCRISVLEQQLEDIIVNQQQQQLSVTCLHDGDDNVSIPDSICLQCLKRNCLLCNVWYMANIHSFIHSVSQSVIHINIAINDDFTILTDPASAIYSNIIGIVLILEVCTVRSNIKNSNWTHKRRDASKISITTQLVPDFHNTIAEEIFAYIIRGHSKNMSRLKGREEVKCCLLYTSDAADE